MPPTIVVYESEDGWRWRLQAGNGEIVAQGEAHTRREDAERAADRAAELMGEATQQDNSGDAGAQSPNE